MSATTNSTHVMVDIETLDTKPSAIILSIGACLIPVTTCQFYAECDENQPDRTYSQSTIEWWAQQSPGLKPNGTQPLIDVLSMFGRWIAQLPGEPIVWAKGIDFDCAILADAYRQYGLPLPWKYNAVRDFRTLKKVCPIGADLVPTLSHNALADAKHQAEWLEHILAEYPRAVYLS